MPTLRVFDPSMCCSSGAGGPSPDPELARFAADVAWLQSHGVDNQRFSLSSPVHEAAASQRDLERAAIQPFAWVVNQSLTRLAVTDPVLLERQGSEGRYLSEVSALAKRVALMRWSTA